MPGVMDEVQHQRHVTALLLDAIGPAGFALAGSGAIREHGITGRPTQDIDLFAASTTSPDAFERAAEAAGCGMDADRLRATLTLT